MIGFTKSFINKKITAFSSPTQDTFNKTLRQISGIPKHKNSFKIEPIKGNQLPIISESVFDQFEIKLQEWPYPPFSIRNISIHPLAFDLESGLLKFFFNHIKQNKQGIFEFFFGAEYLEIDDEIIAGIVNYDSFNPSDKDAVKQELFNIIGETKESQLIFEKALKITRSRLGFATAMACNTETFLDSRFKKQLLQLITNYLFTFFMLDDVLEKTNADQNLISLIKSMFFKSGTPASSSFPDSIDLILRMLYTTINDIKRQVNRIYDKDADQVYKSYMKVYFDQVNSVIEECRQKKEFLEKGEFPADTIFNINRQLTIGYFPFVKIVDLLLGVYDIYDRVLLCRNFDEIGCRRLHLINGLLSFSVEIGDPTINLDQTAEKYLLKNQDHWAAFSNEVLIHSLNEGCTIKRSLHEIALDYNRDGQAALDLTIEILSQNLSRLDYESIVMRSKFMLNEMCDYHRLCGRYKLDKIIDIELQNKLLYGSRAYLEASNLADFKEKLVHYNGYANRTVGEKNTDMKAIHNRLKEHFQKLLGKSQERRKFFTSIKSGDENIRFNRIEEDLIRHHIFEKKINYSEGLFIDQDDGLKESPINIEKKPAAKHSMFFIYGEAGIGKSSIVQNITDKDNSFWFNSCHVNDSISAIQLLGHNPEISDEGPFLDNFSLNIKSVVIDNIHEVTESSLHVVLQLIELSKQIKFNLFFISRESCKLSDDKIMIVKVQPLLLEEVFKKFPFLIYFNDTPLQPLFANPFYLNIIITNFNQSDYRVNTQIKSLFPELDIKNELVSLSVNQSPFDGVNKNVMQNTMKKIANFNLKNIKLKFNGPEIIICKRLCSQGVLKLNGQKYVFAHDLYRDWSQLQLFLSELYRLEDGSIDLTNFLKSTKRLPLIQHYIVMYFNLFVEKYDCLNNHQFKQQYLRNPNDRINFTLTILNLINGVPIHAMDKRFKRGDKNEILLDNLKIVDDDPRASVIASILRSLELSERPLSSFFYNALHQIFSNPLETLSHEKYQEILARYNETSYGYEYEFSEAADNIVATCKLKPRVIKTSLTEVQLPYERFKKYFLSEAIDHFQQRHKSKSNLEDILNSYNSTKKFAVRPFVPPEFGQKYKQYKKFKLFDLVKHLQLVFPADGGVLLGLILKDSPELLLKKDSLNEIPLHIAVNLMDINLVKCLIKVMMEYDINISAVDLDYETPLHNAAYNFKYFDEPEYKGKQAEITEIFSVLMDNYNLEAIQQINPLGMKASYIRGLFDRKFAQEHSADLGKDRWGKSVFDYLDHDLDHIENQTGLARQANFRLAEDEKEAEEASERPWWLSIFS